MEIFYNNNEGIGIIHVFDRKEICLFPRRNMSGRRNTHDPKEKFEKIVKDYNNIKFSVDLSDQMSSHTNILRKLYKCHIQVGLDLVFNSMSNNARIFKIWKTV